MTDELIERLTGDLKPVRPLAMQRLLLACLLPAALVAAFAMTLWLGPRPDIGVAVATMSFWVKFGYTLALAGLGGLSTLVLARPDGHTRWPGIAALLLLASLLIVGFSQIMAAEPGQVMPLVMGSTALVCPWRIVAFGLPILGGALLALRRMAPSSPTLAGFAAGITAGGTGAWVYSFACAETGMMFLALWYTLGILIVGAIGAVLGRFLLRW